MTKWGEVTIRPLGHSGDLGWVILAHGEIYAEEFGWNDEFEAIVARIVADYAQAHDSAREAAWIAERDGERVGCVFVVKKSADVAQLRILLVHPSGRGHGVGRQLVDESVDFVRRAGYRRLVLWTNHPLVAARRIYLDAGFVLSGEEPHRSYGVDLIGQSYQLELTPFSLQGP
jgi:GNAT superfamily N-acetyltransferase